MIPFIENNLAEHLLVIFQNEDRIPLFDVRQLNISHTVLILCHPSISKLRLCLEGHGSVGHEVK